MIDLVLANSRPLATAESLVGVPVSEATVFTKHVVLTGEAGALSTANGRLIAAAAFRLLARVVGRLTIVLPIGMDDLETELRTLAAKICFRSNPEFRQGNVGDLFPSPAAVLNIGQASEDSLPWTTINSNGWIARLASRGHQLPSDMSQANPVAALFAASLGVAEIFKRIVGAPEDHCPPLEQTEFSLFELSTDFSDAGPPLPKVLTLPDTLLVGAGAIGNAIAFLFAQLPFGGRVHVVDKQDYGDENLGTCVLTEVEGWIGVDKAPRLAAWLRDNSGLDVTGERALVRAALGGDSIQALKPEVVLNGLDDVGARHDTQLAWPAIMIDGGINDIGAAVVQHRLDNRGLACLRCTFVATKHIDHVVTQSEMTGLRRESLLEPERPLTVADVAAAPLEKRAWLNEQMQQGRTICSVVTEAGLMKLGVAAQHGFRPSVPFVATASAALVVAELIKAIQFPDRRYAQSFTLGSVFMGPESGLISNRPAAKNCMCVTRRASILASKASRSVALTE